MGFLYLEISNQACFPIMKTQGTTKTRVQHWTENRDAVKVCTPIMRPLSILSTVAPRIILGAEFILAKTGDCRIPELRNWLIQEKNPSRHRGTFDCQDKMVVMPLVTLQWSHQSLPAKHTFQIHMYTHMSHTLQIHTLPKYTNTFPPPHISQRHIYTHVRNTHKPNIHTYHVNREKYETLHLSQHAHIPQAHTHKWPKHTHSTYEQLFPLLLKIWMSNQRQPASWISLRK